MIGFYRLSKKHLRLQPNFLLLAVFLLALQFFCPSLQASTEIERLAEKGYAYRFTDSLKSLRLQQEALQLAITSSRQADEAICYAYLAMTYRRLSQRKEFTRYAELAYDVAQKSQNNYAIAYGNWAVGLLRSYIDDKPSALRYMLKAYGLFETAHADGNCAKLGADISYLFAAGDAAKTKKYADEALRYAELSHDPDNILHARLAVGSYLSEQLPEKDTAQWDQVLKFFTKTIQLAQAAGDKISSKSNLGVAHINLAVLHMHAGEKMDKAAFLSQLEQATQIGRDYGLRNIYRSALGLRGQYFLQQGDFRKAESLFKEGIAYQHTMPYTDNELFASFYACLKDLALQEKQYQQYAAYDQLFDKYNKLNYNENIQQILQNTDARFESAKRLSRIEQLEAENALQRQNQLLGYGIAAVLLIGLLFLYKSYYYRQRYFQKREDVLQQEQQNSALQVQLMEKESLETLSEKLALERRLLQSQMDPHFIFNLLGNIQSIILKQDRLLAVNHLGKFAKLTRQVLEQSRMEYISLETEIDSLKTYIELQQLRLNNSFDYQIYCEPAVDLQLSIPPLLLQPFVENAIEHGLKPLSGLRRGILQLELTWDKPAELLRCSIRDNGIGRAASRKHKTGGSHRSLASKITDERLALLLQQNPHTRMEIVDCAAGIAESGCIVNLFIPIR